MELKRPTSIMSCRVRDYLWSILMETWRIMLMFKFQKKIMPTKKMEFKSRTLMTSYLKIVPNIRRRVQVKTLNFHQSWRVAVVNLPKPTISIFQMEDGSVLHAKTITSVEELNVTDAVKPNQSRILMVSPSIYSKRLVLSVVLMNP